jgi:hypothetical protein
LYKFCVDIILVHGRISFSKVVNNLKNDLNAVHCVEYPSQITWQGTDSQHSQETNYQVLLHVSLLCDWVMQRLKLTTTLS